MIVQKINVDVGTQTAEDLHYVQSEEGRTIVFSFINSFDIDPDTEEPSSVTIDTYDVSINILKPDGNFTIANCIVDSTTNTASYTLTAQDTIAGGSGIYDLSLTKTGELIYTAHGKYKGDNKAISDGSINSVSSVYGVPFPEGYQQKLIAGANIVIEDNVISASGGGGGTSDYRALTNKPSINNVTLTGDKSLTDLNIQAKLIFDNTPTASSSNPVKSDGVYTALTNKVDTNKIGANNGVAELDATGHVPSSQLPSYVDDVIEAYYYQGAFYKDSAHTQLITGETGKIYIDIDTNLSYRWTGSGYAEISPSLALGETSSTAYRGDRGKIAYDTALANETAIANIHLDIGSIQGDITTINNNMTPTSPSVNIDTTNVSSGSAYCRKMGRLVILNCQGLVTPANGKRLMYNLPIPDSTVPASAYIGGAITLMNIDTNGELKMLSVGTTTPSFFALTICYVSAS